MKQFQEKNGQYRWADTDLLAYKEEGTHFKSITRQILFGEAEGLACQLRYFEIASGGHSTLERHEHVHAVMIIRGQGQVLVGDQVKTVKCFDLIHVPPTTWHQLRANLGESLGFLCMVACERDRPQRPDEAAIQEMSQNKAVAEFIRT